MTENRLFAGWLRSLTGLVAVAGVLGLSACGGGSGAPNNFFTGTLTVLPATAVAYSGVPTTLTISGGTGPYRAFSSNSAILPVPQTVPGKTVVLLAGNVAADTDVTITVQDAARCSRPPPRCRSTVTVRAAPLLNSLTITPNLADCGTEAICSGQNGTASVTVLGPQGGPLAGRAVRFDVVGTAYAIATNNPAQPFVTSLVVISDANGVASVIIKANVNAATQFAQMTATDLTSGQQLTGNFVIQQVTDGAAILTVVPDDRQDQRRLQGRMLGRVRHRLLHLRRHAALSRHVDVPELDLPGQFDRQCQWRLLRGHHQRQLCRPVDVLDPGCDGPPDDGDAARTSTGDGGPAGGDAAGPRASRRRPTRIPPAPARRFPFVVTGGTPSYNVKAATIVAAASPVATSGHAASTASTSSVPLRATTASPRSWSSTKARRRRASPRRSPARRRSGRNAKADAECEERRPRAPFSHSGPPVRPWDPKRRHGPRILDRRTLPRSALGRATQPTPIPAARAAPRERARGRRR